MAPPAPNNGGVRGKEPKGAASSAPASGSPIIGGGGGKGSKTPRLIGWQGFAVHVPEAWDLTGFSGDYDSGYLRIDDGEEQGLEVKWGTETKRKRALPDVDVRRESYFRSLRQAAKKKRLELETRETEPPRGTRLDDRLTAGFTWTGDRKAFGLVWHCKACRRTVIAQVLGAPSGRGGLAGISDAVLSSLRCHGEDRDWRTWALYDLVTQVPSEYVLTEQQLMNVYLRLTFTHGTARLSVEQWAVANVARRDAYLDTWLASNSRAEIHQARYKPQEDSADHQGHPTLRLIGGLGLGMPMIQAARQVMAARRPATRFSARAWECEPSNKIYSVQSLRPAKSRDIMDEVVARTVCHADAG